MPRMPHMFTCAVCGLELKPSDPGVDRKAIVWLKGATKTVSEFVEDVYEYKHRVCNERNAHINDIPLF